METVDRINARFGRDVIHLAATGNERQWRMKQEHLSPRYTYLLVLFVWLLLCCASRG